MRRPVTVFACLVATAAGCGGDGGQQRVERASVPVALAVTAPSDNAVVRTETVKIRGTVRPARAVVRVVGEEADVTGGVFSAEVALEPGANVIDVMATAPGRGPAMTAVRVTRELPVPVPDLGGLEVAEAQERVAEVGLALEVTEEGGLLDELLPGEPAVCEQDPSPGEEVRRGTTVDVEVRRSC